MHGTYVCVYIYYCLIGQFPSKLNVKFFFYCRWCNLRGTSLDGKRPYLCLLQAKRHLWTDLFQSHTLTGKFFFFFFLFPTIIDRKIVDSMIIYCTVWFPVVAKSTAKYLQEERLRRLKHRMKICFDGSRQEHQVCCCFV